MMIKLMMMLKIMLKMMLKIMLMMLLMMILTIMMSKIMLTQVDTLSEDGCTAVYYAVLGRHPQVRR